MKRLTVKYIDNLRTLLNYHALLMKFCSEDKRYRYVLDRLENVDDPSNLSIDLTYEEVTSIINARLVKVENDLAELGYCAEE